MKHNHIVSQLLQAAQRDPNIAGRLPFGPAATGTHRPGSDVGVITILVANNPAWGMNNAANNGLKVGDIFFTVEVLAHRLETVPHLLHPLAETRLPFDRDGSIAPIQQQIKTCVANPPALVDEWHAYYRQLKRMCRHAA